MDKILVIDDDFDICDLLKRFLTKKGYEVHTVHNGENAIELLKKNTFDVVLCDFRLPDQDGLTLLKKAKIINPTIAFIIITGYTDVKIAVKAIKHGAFEYVTKPLHPDEILDTVKKALDKKKNKTEDLFDTESPTKKELTTKKKQPSKYIHGESVAAQKVLEHIELVAPTDMTVIIQGETGTGKEYIANTIHNLSKRKDYPFIAIDCGALTNELAGSELFGHVKGAFTGAVNAKAGSFEEANGGTIFLDEIGNLPYEIQVKLLRAIQERKINRIGETKERPIDVRILVATNDNLKQEAEKGNFREDLFHRLNEFGIQMPPLRERKEDIMLFANFFLEHSNSDLDKNVEGFSNEVVAIFERYPWHGNLREMRNVVKRAVLLTQGTLVGKETLPHEITYYQHETFNFEENGTSSTPNLKASAGLAERKTILKVLEQTGNNKSKAAKLLKIDRKTLYNKLKEYEISL